MSGTPMRHTASVQARAVHAKEHARERRIQAVDWGRRSDRLLGEGRPVDISQLQNLLAKHRAELDAFGVAELHVFGSVARGEARPDSDVDIMVRFAGPASIFTLVHLKDFLEELVGRRVDLVTEAGLRPWMRESVREEAIRAA